MSGSVSLVKQKEGPSPLPAAATPTASPVNAAARKAHCALLENTLKEDPNLAVKKRSRSSPSGNSPPVSPEPPSKRLHVEPASPRLDAMSAPSPIAQSSSVKALAESSALARLSHEGRNSIGGTQSALVVLRDSLRPNQLTADQMENLTRAILCAEQTLAHFTNYLNMAKFSQAHPKLASDPFTMQSLQSLVASQVDAKALLKEIHYTFVIDPQIPFFVVGDRNRLCQILVNFIGNAIKFTPNRGTVAVCVKIEKQTDAEIHLRFEVKDTGRGIAPGDYAKVFQPYSQVGPHLTGIEEGTGLGLCICKELIELMNCQPEGISSPKPETVGFTSEVGKGSTFWFTVPVKKMPPSASSSCSPALFPLSPMLRSSLYNLPKPLPAASAGAAGSSSSSLSRSFAFDRTRSLSVVDPLKIFANLPPTPFPRLSKKISVLVVDDQPVNRKLTVAMLKQLGCEAGDVGEAGTGEEAVLRASERNYDVMLLDFNLGHATFNGLQVAEKLRKLKPQLRMIGLTGESESAVHAQCRQAGMHSVITKPVSKVVLVEALEGT